MIEKIIIDYLADALDVPVKAEKDEDCIERYVLVEKTGGGETECVSHPVVIIQSYAESLYEAMLLNRRAKKAMLRADELPQISKVSLNSDYNYTDPARKEYRYQAVYDLVYLDDEED